MGSVNGVENLAISYTCDVSKCAKNPAYGTDFYGFYTSCTNFTMEITGYFLAKQTGTYKLNLPVIDDSVILQFGHGVAFDCCNQNAKPIESEEFTINGIQPWEG